MSNKIKDKLNKKEVLSGCFIGMHSPYLAEVTGYMGFDFVVIDNEHGSFSWGEVEEMVRAIEITSSTPIVRVPSSSPIDILKALDRGAKGIQVPQVETPEEVEMIVKSANYPPKGTRGVAFSIRAAQYGIRKGRNYMDKSNEDVFISIQLETPTAISNVNSIMQKDIDMIYIGPTDLSVSANQATKGIYHPDVYKMVNKVFEAGRNNNVDVGIHVANSSEWKERKHSCN